MNNLSYSSLQNEPIHLTKTLAFCLVFMHLGIGFSQSYYEYNFVDNFSEVKGIAPDLIPICSGAFMTDAINSCVKKGVYHFDFNCGLAFDNEAADNYISDEYTIEMYFKFQTLNSWKRIIDYKNRESDWGLYGFDGRVNFYNLTTSADAPFFANRYAHILVTRQAFSNEYKVYVDGLEYISFIDSNKYGTLSEENKLIFFQDDTVVKDEASEGEVSLIRIYDYILTPDEVFNNFTSLSVTEISVEICSGETYKGYSESGIYRDTFSSTLGCDSIRILNLLINQSIEIKEVNVEESINTVSVNVVGGIQPIEYSLDGVNFQNSRTFQDLLPGTYTVTVKDKIGCASNKSFSIPENTSNNSCLEKNGEACFLLGRWEGVFDQYSCNYFGKYPMVVEIEMVSQDSFTGRFIWPTLNSETGMKGYIDADNNKVFLFETNLLGGREVVLNGIYESTIIDCENLKGFWYVNELQSSCPDPQTLIDGGNYEIQKTGDNCVKHNNTFQMCFGGNEEDAGIGIEIVNEQIYVVSNTKSYGAGVEDLMLNKISSNGDNIIWTNVFGTQKRNLSGGIKIIENDLLLFGQTVQNNTSQLIDDVFLRRYNTNGDLIWENYYGKSARNDDEHIGGFSVLDDNEILFSAYNLTKNGSVRDGYIAKTDANGEYIWSFRYDSIPSVTESIKNVFSLSNSYYASGEMKLSAVNKQPVFLMRTNQNGEILWWKHYNIFNKSNVFHYTSEPLSDGNILIVGGIEYTSTNKDILLIKTDSDGNVLWSKSIGGSKNEQVFSIVESDDNNIYLCGITNSFGMGSNDGLLIKISLDGDILWSKTYGGDQEDKFNDIRQANNGDLVVVGTTHSFGTPSSSNIYLIRCTSEGEIFDGSCVSSQAQFSIVDEIIEYSEGGHTLPWQERTEYTFENTTPSIMTCSQICCELNSFELATICPGEEYEGYNSTGIYMDTFTTKSGCDSLRILDLIVLDSLPSNSSVIIIQDEEIYEWQGINFSNDTTVCRTFSAINGCDSIHCITLNKSVSEKSCSTNNRANIWYFGRNAGLDFNTEPPTPLLDGALNIWEGSATICDAEGQLMIYTDGRKIWNKNHEVMSGANNLGGNNSATQSGIIVPKPGSENILFVFSVDFEGGSGGLQYAIVDMNLNTGLGGLTSSNNILLNRSTEKITVIPHANQQSLWIIAHEFNNANFVIWELDERGLSDNPTVTTIGSIHGPSGIDAIGYMKASPNGDKLALTTGYTLNEVELFDFDNQQGVISNLVKISIEKLINPYGVEFSPNGNYLYLAGAQNQPYVYIYQLDLTLSSPQEIVASAQIIGTGTSSTFGALQTGPDGRIYITKEKSKYLSVISSPNEVGLACGFEEDVVFLGGRTAEFGLPNLIPSFFKDEVSIDIIEKAELCEGLVDLQLIVDTQSDSFEFQWFFEGNIIGDKATKDIQVKESGDYMVEVIVFNSCKASETKYAQEIEVQIEDVIKIKEVKITNAHCGRKDGTITVEINPNSGVYTYALNEITDFQESNTFQLLEAGDYTLTVKNSNGCTYEERFSIESMELPLVATIETVPTSCGEDNGIITILAEKESNLAYSIDGITYMENNTFKNLASGNYPIFIRNQNCLDTLEAMIDNSEPIHILDIEVIPASCGDNIGSLTVFAEESVNLQYAIGETAYQEDNQFSNLLSGTYQVSIRDDNDCIAMEEVMIPQASSLAIEKIDINAPRCTEKGSLTFDLTGGTGKITTVFNQQELENTTSFFDLTAGTYNIIFYDESSCNVDTTLVFATSCPVYVPNVFSPNSDGLNDLFKIYTSTKIEAKVKTYAIYNRWGNLIYEAKNFSINSLDSWWDGTFDNQRSAATGVFIYHIEVEFENGRTDLLKGDIVIY